MTDFLHGNVDNIQLQLQDPNGNQDSAVEEPTVRSDIVVNSEAFPVPDLYKGCIRNVEIIDSVGTGRVLVTTTERDLKVDITSVQGEMQWYELTRKVADAKFGEVWHALQLERVVESTATSPALFRYIEPKREIAVKMLEKEQLDKEIKRQWVLDEIAALQFLGCHGGNRYVIGELGTYYDDNGHMYYILMEYHYGGELRSVVEDLSRLGTTLSHENSRRYFKQIIEGLRYCHSHGVAHMDMSLENILYVQETNDIKIIDFDRCLRVPRHENGSFLYVTPPGAFGKWKYMAPEVVQNSDRIDPMKSDIWALGVILFTMLCGFPPLNVADNTDQRYQMIAQGRLERLVRVWELEENLRDGALDLIQRILKPNPGSRLTLDEILFHPWVNGPVDGDPPQTYSNEVHEGSTMTTDEAATLSGSDEGNSAMAMET